MRRVMSPVAASVTRVAGLVERVRRERGSIRGPNRPRRPAASIVAGPTLGSLDERLECSGDRLGGGHRLLGEGQHFARRCAVRDHADRRALGVQQGEDRPLRQDRLEHFRRRVVPLGRAEHQHGVAVLEMIERVDIADAMRMLVAPCRPRPPRGRAAARDARADRPARCRCRRNARAAAPRPQARRHAARAGRPGRRRARRRRPAAKRQRRSCGTGRRRGRTGTAAMQRAHQLEILRRTAHRHVRDHGAARRPRDCARACPRHSPAPCR